MQTNTIKRVLVVDDDEDNITIFSLALNAVLPEAGIFHAPNGKVAIDMLQPPMSLPEIIFLDLEMPIMNGKEFLKSTRQCPRISSVPLLVCSSTRDKNDVEEIRALGAKGFIPKPSTFSDFKAMLRLILFNDLPPGKYANNIQIFSGVQLAHTFL